MARRCSSGDRWDPFFADTPTVRSCFTFRTLCHFPSSPCFCVPYTRGYAIRYPFARWQNKTPGWDEMSGEIMFVQCSGFGRGRGCLGWIRMRMGFPVFFFIWLIVFDANDTMLCLKRLAQCETIAARARWVFWVVDPSFFGGRKSGCVWEVRSSNSRRMHLWKIVDKDVSRKKIEHWEC